CFGNELSRLRRASAHPCWIFMSACSSSELRCIMHDRLPGEAASQTWHESLETAEHQPQEMRIGKFCFRSLPHNDRPKRWNNEKALIVRAERDHHVRRRILANADVCPLRGLPW